MALRASASSCELTPSTRLTADAAHLTRTFYQMVGMAPSALMRGDFIEIASPFNALPQGSEERQYAGPTR